MSLKVCDRCGKVISATKFSRHRKRCGKKPVKPKIVTDDNVAQIA